MTDETLKPCPFCGGEAHTYKNNLWHVACENAHNSCVTMSAFVTEAEAIAAWNTRDCKHYEYWEFRDGRIAHDCARDGDYLFDTEPNGFCSWGERRDA